MNESRSLLGDRLLFAFEYIRAKKLQIHEAGRRDAVAAPLAYRLRFDIAQTRRFSGSADCIDHVVR